MELSADRLQKGLQSISDCGLTGIEYRDWVRFVCSDLLAGRTAECWNCGMAIHDGPCANDDDYICEPAQAVLDPVALLAELAGQCDLNEYRAFWVLSSAAAYLRGEERDFSATTSYALDLGWVDL